jgi:hypothetical protein
MIGSVPGWITWGDMDASQEQRSRNRLFDELVRALQEYLETPTIIIAVFIVLGLLMPFLENAGIPAVDGLRPEGPAELKARPYSRSAADTTELLPESGVPSGESPQ